MNWRELEIIYKDDMTGLLNKRFFIDAQGLIEYEDIHLILFDIDDFKYVNDIYGHYTGDIVIKEIGSILYDFADSTIYPIRYGGDEFIVILSGSKRNTPDRFMENMRRSVENRIITANSYDLNVTCSFGCSTGKMHEIEELLKQADTALYDSKDKGKNCCSMYSGRRREQHYFPNPVQRRIQAEIAKGKHIIVKGTFCSGKNAMAKRIMPERYGMTVLNMDRNDKYDTGRVFILHNPAITGFNSDKHKVLYRIKKEGNAEFCMQNLKKEEIAGYLEMFGHIPTLFTVNYLDIATSGNIGVLNGIVNSGKLFNRPACSISSMEPVIALLDRHILEMLEIILPAGIRFNVNRLRSMGIDQSVAETLYDLLLLEKRQGNYAYTYTPLYFYMIGKFKVNIEDNEYNRILEYASMLNEKAVTEREREQMAEYMYNYGDLHIANQLLSKTMSDEAMEIKAKIHISLAEYDKAEELLKRMKNNESRHFIEALLSMQRGKPVEYNGDNTDANLVKLAYLARGGKQQEFDELYVNLKCRELSPRQTLSMYYAQAFHFINNDLPAKGMKELSRARKLCLREHYIGDYAKIMMSTGIFEDSQGRRDAALKSFKTALSIFRLNSNTGGIRSASLNLAVIYTNIGDYNKAAGIYSELLTMPVVENSLYHRGIILNNMAELYLRWWKVSEAMEYCDKALKVFAEGGRVPDYMHMLKDKIMLAKGKKPASVDYYKSDDIIDDIDRHVMKIALKELLITDCESEIDSIIQLHGSSEMDYKHECIMFLALVFRDRIDMRNTFLNRAAAYFRSRDMYVRERKIIALMEE